MFGRHAPSGTFQHPHAPLNVTPRQYCPAVTAPLVPGARAALSVFDLTGRRVAVVRGPSGAALVWEGKDQSGTLVGPGIYLYRLEAGNHRQEGKVVVFR